MTPSRPTTQTYTAPETLGLETRDRVRKDSIKLLDSLPEGDGRLVIDLAATRQVDSAGLGALMLVQRHAGERRQAVALVNVSEEIRFLLVLTKLDELFERDAERAGAS
jgi:anti-anti-sigma regulatory factor